MLDEHMPSDFPSNRRVALTSFMRFSRECVKMFLHPTDISLAESFTLVSNICHVEIMT